MRKLLVVILVLLLVGVGADFAAARVFEGRAAAAIAQRLQLERPIVQVRPRPAWRSTSTACPSPVTCCSAGQGG